MKRDLDFMREILLTIEASDGPLYLPLTVDPPRPPGDAALQVQLLKDAGYIEAVISPIRESSDIAGAIIRMTNSGYDYLDTVRDPKVWSQTKGVLEKIGGSAALEVVKDIAAKFMVELIKPFISGG
jgi:Hypothetical protein (DUF2513)